MIFIDKLLMSKKLKFIDKPLSMCLQYCEKRKLDKEKKWKKHCLYNYGAYHNADELNQEEMLQVFWKVLKDHNSYYDVSNFNSTTNIEAPTNQSWEWGDLGGMEFFDKLEKVFGLPYRYITDDEYSQIKTFGELADLIIRKAKEKKGKGVKS